MCITVKRPNYNKKNMCMNINIYIYILTHILIQYACITLHYTFVDAYKLDCCTLWQTCAKQNWI